MENKKITIGLNISYLRKLNTGIGQVSINFLRQLVAIENKEIEFILYLEEDFSGNLKLPKNFNKKIILPLYKRDDLIRKIWWEKFLLPRQAKNDCCDFFISLYQCPTILDKSIKHIMVVHDIIPKLFREYLDNSRKKLYWKLTEYGIKKSDKIIAVSKRTEKDLIQYLKIAGERVAVDYIDVDEIYKKDISQKENLRVLKKYKLKPGYIFAGGGYEVRKNVEGVIRAYKMLLDRNKNEHFLQDFPCLAIYGKILSEKNILATPVEKLINELNLTKKVKILGMTTQEDLPALFNNATLFAYPSFYEGFGMPVLEAMSVGTSVITSKVSSLPEVGSDSVLYCNPNDISDIAMVMKNILINKNLRDDLKSRSKQRAKNFSWEKFTQKILNIIREK